MTSPNAVLLGGIVHFPNSKQLLHYRSIFRSVPFSTPLLASLTELTSVLEKVSSQLPFIDPELSRSIQRIPPAIAEWLKTGSTGCLENFELSIACRTTLTVLFQILSYFHYLQSKYHDSHETLRTCALQAGGYQGLCIGRLSAAALSSAITVADIPHYTEIALRFAFAIGIYVEVDESRCRSAGVSSQTFAATWTDERSSVDICATVRTACPQAYVGVVHDLRCITITVPTIHAESLIRTVRGLHVKIIDVPGRFHCPETTTAAVQLVLSATSHCFRREIRERTRTSQSLDSVDRKAEQSELTWQIVNSILREQTDWYGNVTDALCHLEDQNIEVLFIGKHAVPCTISKRYRTVDAELESCQDHTSTMTNTSEYGDDAIAVVGMAFKGPGADTPSELWELLRQGRSTLAKAPADRFVSSRRTSPDQNFWGHFMRDIKVFDNGYFRKSPREASQMDPQQRLLLMTAAEALESSGYFADTAASQDIGVYLGACAVDYDFNVAGSKPTAYSATGTLRSFLSGKLSHHFGWSGPSIVIDTACSSSAVAIHTACSALRAGDCQAALAGGISLMTAPYLYENFHAARFLTPTGGCKAFSEDADGYCRGEGVGLVVLKRLSDATEAQDHILAVISSSAVNQNENAVPITVPHSDSQAQLYRKILASSKLQAQSVSFVEAHGTGTPVGDPIEMESIRRVFGSPERDSPLYVGSVKANIGHLEAASGVAALIKSVLQIQHRQCVEQISMRKLNPTVGPLKGYGLAFPGKDAGLPTDRRLVACVNNYGAAGSNAAMLVQESPQKQHDRKGVGKHVFCPVQITAASQSSVLQYAKKLSEFCSTASMQKDASPWQDLAFNLSDRRDPRQAFSLSLVADSYEALASQISNIQPDDVKVMRDKQGPIVLCFGGQAQDRVALSQELYESSKLLQGALKECDDTMAGLGYSSIFPAIFEDQPVTDVVALHSIQFAAQYACAKAWLRSGLEVQAMIGHSFGQLTAMVCCGVLTLADGIRLVVGRARLIKTDWIGERGTMVSVCCDAETLDDLRRELESRGKGFEVACYNGPNKRVLVTDTLTAELLVSDLLPCLKISHKMLNVAYGYHSRYADAIIPGLEALASQLTFRPPNLHLETCTKGESWTSFDAQKMTSHTRDPVYFDSAVLRLHDRLGPCTWIEAGIGSRVTGLVRAAFKESSSAYLPGPATVRDLAVTTLELWRTGSRVAHWPFAREQRLQYARISIPFYAWDLTPHWVELDQKPAHADPSFEARDEPTEMLSVVGQTHNHSARLVITRQSAEYRALSSDKPCEPTTLLYLASRAVEITRKQANPPTSIREVRVIQLLEQDDLAKYHVHVQHLADGGYHVEFRTDEASQPVATCILDYSPATGREGSLRTFARVVDKDRALSIRDHPEHEALRGNVMYRMLECSLQCPAWCRGVESIAALGAQLVARVHAPGPVPQELSRLLVQGALVPHCFLQVAQLHAHCLFTDQDAGPGKNTWQLSSVDRVQWVEQQDHGPGPWDVAAFWSHTDSHLDYDLFAFDPDSGDLSCTILGVRLVAVSDVVRVKSRTETPAISSCRNEESHETPDTDSKLENGEQSRTVTDVFEQIRELISSLIGVRKSDISPGDSFDDLGIDSLMVVEVLSDLSALFEVDLPPAELRELTDLDSLVKYLVHDKHCGSKNSDRVAECRRDSSNSSQHSDISSQSASTLDPDPSISCESELSEEDFPGAEGRSAGSVIDAFSAVRTNFAKHAEKAGAQDFWKCVQPEQLHIVCHYIRDAYEAMDLSLMAMSSGEEIPLLTETPEHNRLCNQLLRHLTMDGYAEWLSARPTRTSKSFERKPTSALVDIFVRNYPNFENDMQLLQSTGPRLADFINGKADPLSIIFGNKMTKQKLDEFYRSSPISRAGNDLIAECLSSIKLEPGRRLKILEIGGGTGATTHAVISKLSHAGVEFEYTFSDISSSLVQQAKKQFKNVNFTRPMQFTVLNCEKSAPTELEGCFDVIISTNCVHATRNLEKTAACILPMLRKHGALFLVEYTRNLPWFDLVFGLLDGWWAFDDGRDHAIAPITSWDRSLRAAGFQHVDWSDGSDPESQTERVICALAHYHDGPKSAMGGSPLRRAGVLYQELPIKELSGLVLMADVYLPSAPDAPGKKRPIALMIHGGGHFLFGRKDIPMKHVRKMLERGLLPVSVDYRLCPEMCLAEGPMSDCCEALRWARNVLPTCASLDHVSVKPDGDRVIAFGWSSGGHLALTLGYTAIAAGIPPPDAIFALYPPSDMESEHWHQPCYPLAAQEEPQQIENILEGVEQEPIVEYAPVSEKPTLSLSLTLNDPRARIILDMSWNCTTLPILVSGLPHKETAHELEADSRPRLPVPTEEQIKAISPLWHIKHGDFATPTFFTHGNADDWLPLSMTLGTAEALQVKNVPVEVAVADGCAHAFDLFPTGDPKRSGWSSIEKGYDFVCRYVGL